MSTHKRKIKIAGAGPAGLTAAICLAKRGFEVEVHEAKSEVGSRWKRGLQIIENFSEDNDILAYIREAGIEINFKIQPVRACELWNGHKQSKAFQSPQALGYFVNRGARPGALDQALYEQACAAGVEIRFNSTVKPDADMDIFSTGPRRIDGLGKEVTFETPLSDRMIVILDPVLAPAGYAYFFVVDHKATIGMAILQRFREVDRLFEKVVERFQSRETFAIEKGETSYSYANFFTKKTLQHNGHILIGEAAGFQDYLFGFGIRYAMQSGVLAARSIGENLSFDALWQKLGRKQDITLWNRFFYEHAQNWLPSFFIRLAEGSPDFRRYMRGWYSDHSLRLMMMSTIRKIWSKRKLHVEQMKPYAYTELKH